MRRLSVLFSLMAALVVTGCSSQSEEVNVYSARKEALDKAVAAGADPASVEVMEVEEVPLTYIPSNAVRVRVKAVGNLANIGE